MTDITSSQTTLGIKYVARTDVGLVRAKNEDNFIVSKSVIDDNWVVPQQEFEVSSEGSAFIVADGMGGAVAGQIASSIATEAIKTYLSVNLHEASDDLNIRIQLNKSLLYANEQILKYSNDKPEYAGMGTTATICYLKGAKLYISWIGDSRVYRYSELCRVTTNAYNSGDLEILTDDHSVVWEDVIKGKMTPEEARVAHNSNVITQSLGDPFRTPRPDHRVYYLYEGDLILNCSDGLNSMLSDDQLSFIFDEYRFSSEALSDKLIEEAKNQGGTDNITTVLMQVVKGPKFLQVVSDTLVPKEEKIEELDEMNNTDVKEEQSVELNEENHNETNVKIDQIQNNVEPTETKKGLPWITIVFSLLLSALLAYTISNWDSITKLFVKPKQQDSEQTTGELYELLEDNRIIEPTTNDNAKKVKSNENLSTQKTAEQQRKVPLKKVSKKKAVKKTGTLKKSVIRKAVSDKKLTPIPKYQESKSKTISKDLEEKKSKDLKDTSPKEKTTVGEKYKATTTDHGKKDALQNENADSNIKKDLRLDIDVPLEVSIEEVNRALDKLNKTLGDAQRNRRKTSFLDSQDLNIYENHSSKLEEYINQISERKDKVSIIEFDLLFHAAMDECRELKNLFNDYNIELK